MIPRRGVVALVLLGAVGGYAWWDWRSGRAREEREAEAKKAFHFAEAEVASIHLRRGEEEILLEKAGEDWAIQKPLATPADGAKVGELLSSLLGTTIERRLGPGDDPSAYSLDEPAAEVEIGSAGGEGKEPLREKVRLGDQHPFSHEYYARLGDPGEVVLLSSGIGRAKEIPLLDLRDRKLVGLQAWKMRSLEIQRGKEEIRLVREGGNWHLESPVRTPAEGGAVADLVSHLGRLEAQAFPAENPDDLEPYGLAAPRARVTALQEDWTEPLRIDFGSESPGGNLYARRWDRAAVMEVEKAIWPKLNLPLAEIRGSKLFLAGRWNLGRLVVEPGGEALRIETNGEGEWIFPDREGRPDRGAVEEFLDALEGLEAEGYIDSGTEEPGRFGLDPPRFRLQALSEEEKEKTEEGGPAPYELQVGGPTGNGQVYARIAGWPTIFRVPESAVNGLLERAEALRVPAPEPATEAGDLEEGGEDEPQEDTQGP